MQVAVFCMPKDDRIIVTVSLKELGQFDRGVRQVLNWESDVLNNDSSAALTYRANRGKHTRPNLPEQGLFRCIMGEEWRSDELELSNGLFSRSEERRRVGKEGRSR